MKKTPPAHNTRNLLILIFILLFIGIIVISSSTSVYSQSLYGSPYRFTILQAGWIVLGLIGFYFFYKYDYKKLDRLSYFLFVGTIVLLLLLALVGFLPCDKSISFIPCINGANRWLFLNPAPLPEVPFLGVVGFQPGELAKLSLIIYLSIQISKNLKRNEDVFVVYAVVSGLTSLLILFQPNMSTAVMVFALGSMIYFSSDAPLGTLLKMVPIALVAVVILVVSSPYRRERLVSLLGLGKEETSYHMEQILISLGSGGLTGVGFGQSMQKFHYLPEIASDSIFAVIGEEFGLIGTTTLVVIFSYFIYIGYRISQESKDTLGRLLAVGITSWVALQFFVNTAAMTGIIPLTGVPMPLISYGGSSMVFSMMGMGILASISRDIESS
ncbi:FtsW/RodA/SpoVE family cell cycle protein [Patescibacteria group bacterium]|nr:FtsW/RodA/SpoVE family cell cycle protein [Patescibacteria group bacterium]